MEKEELLKCLSHRKLVIRGAGALAKEFYENYGRKLKISYCTSNRAGECLEGLSRIEPKEVVKKKEEYFVIVCVGDYESVSFELIADGLMPGQHFFSSRIIAGLTDEKKVFLAVGQCELAVTDYVFQKTSLNEKYLFLYYDEYKVLGIEDKRPLLQCVLEVNALIGMTDYFVYPVNLSSRCEYYDGLVGRVKADCRTISVPLSTFEGYWPQDGAKDYYEKSVYYLSPCALMLRRDKNIEDAFENGTERDILQMTEKDDFYDEEYVKKGFERTLKKFELLDRKADVKISDYYREHYRTKKIFLDRGHAADFVLREYARRILECLGIAFSMEEIEAVDLNWYNNCHPEFPIYPSVNKGLDFKEKDERYRLIYKDGNRYLSFKEYMEYIWRNVQSGRAYLKGIRINEE